jgi:hypothetical protein
MSLGAKTRLSEHMQVISAELWNVDGDLGLYSDLLDHF